jgi:hypothetical protein
MLASGVVDHRFKTWPCQTKDYKIDICCFYAKHAALRINSKDWLVRGQDNVSEWMEMVPVDSCLRWYHTLQVKFDLLV